MQQVKSFLFYLDNKDVLAILTDAQLGTLLRYLIDFAETGTMQEIEDASVFMAYRFMTAQMRRDMDKYEQKCQKNSENGKKGGRPSKKANGFQKTQKSERLFSKPKKAYTDIETDTVTETKTDTAERASPKPAAPARQRYGEFHHVLLAQAEYARLVSDFGETVTADYIRRLDEYLEQTGKTYRNHSLTIRKWLAKDGQNAKEDLHAKYAGTAAGKGFI